MTYLLHKFKLLKFRYLEFLDLSSIFKAYGPLKLKVHPIDAHPNEIAHSLIDEAIVNYASSHPELMKIVKRKTH